jgi:hypothetical protein
MRKLWHAIFLKRFPKSGQHKGGWRELYFQYLFVQWNDTTTNASALSNLGPTNNLVIG